jgi:acyl-CoA synthetase (NDP forming)
LVLDRASELGVELATIGSGTSQRLAGLLDEGLLAENPVDAWGSGHAANDVFAGCLQALADDPAVGALAFAVDLTSEEDGGPAYAAVAAEVAASTEKPLAVLANLSSGVDPRQAEFLAEAGVPLLYGTDSGLRALRHLLHHRPTIPDAPTPIDEEWDLWRRRLLARPLDEVEALDLVAAAGIPVAPLHRCQSLEGATAIAAEVGYPLAVKAVGLGHKTEEGGLRVGIDNARDLGVAWRALEELGHPLALQQMVDPGLEIALGLVNDSQVGPVVMVGAGGTLVELLEDREFVWPPLTYSAADAILSSLRLDRLLRGYRHSRPLAREQLIAAIVALSQLATAVGDLVSSLDINPVIVSEVGIVAVDALIASDPPLV